MTRQEFVKLPSEWMKNDGLKQFRWSKGIGSGSDNIAALMNLMALAHNAEPDSGAGTMTYDALALATGLSRSKISKGLDVLDEMALIVRNVDGRSTYQLADYNPFSGWCKLPSRRLYANGRIYPLQSFRLRTIAELDAMKIYFLLIAQRGNDTNQANISLKKISERTGVDPHRVKTGLSILTVRSMVYTERTPSMRDPERTANAYRIVGIDPYRHDGTRSDNSYVREVDFSDF